MNDNKRTKLESAGWQLGSTAEVLELTPEEAAYIELKLTLSTALRKMRVDQGLTQSALAKRMASSQSRVAKMEASDPSVSIDLLFKALLASGATPRELARIIGDTPEPRAA